MKLSVPVRCDAVVCSDGYEYEAECSTVSLDIQNVRPSWPQAGRPEVFNIHTPARLSLFIN